MGPVKCHYRNCFNRTSTKSMFPFPVDDDTRLNKWIKNSGNDLLKSLTRQDLRHHYICEAHFDTKYVLKDEFRSKLVPTAVPLISCKLGPDSSQNLFCTKPKTGWKTCNYINCENTNRTHSFHHFPKDADRLRVWIKNAGNPKLKKLGPESLHNRFLCGDHFDECYKNPYSKYARLIRTAIPTHYKGKESDNIDSEESNESEESNKREESNETECENEVSDPGSISHVEEEASYVEVFGSSCLECSKPIMGFGFQWWCIQCVAPRCSVCIMRMVHRSHFVLRLPANTRPKEVEIMIAAIQKELQLQGFFTREEDKDSDQGETADEDMDEPEQILNEEPVKAEPPDEEQDPLAECFNDPPNSQPKETTNNCSFLAEHRPDSQSNDFRPDKNLGLEGSLKTPTDIQSRKYSHRSYRPSKSLGRNRKNTSLDNTEHSSLQKSSDLEVSIDYQPNQKSTGDEVSISYHQSIDTSLGLEDSFELESPFLGLNGLYDPDSDYILHSASLQSAPVGPVSHVPVGVLNPDLTGLKLSGSGSGFGGASVQSGAGLQSIVAGNQQPTNKDLHPPSNKRKRVLNFPKDVETDLHYTETPQVTNKDHRSQQSEVVSLKADALNSKEIKELNNSPKYNKRKLTETIKQTIDNNKTVAQVQVYSTHKKQSVETIIKKDNQEKQKSTESSENLKESKKCQPPRHVVHSTHTKKSFKNTAIQMEDHSKHNLNTQDPMNDPHIPQQLKNYVNFSHEKKSIDNVEQNNQNKTQQLLNQVYSGHKKQSTDIIEREDNKSKSNTREPSKVQQPQILVYSTHKKLNYTDISDTSEHKKVYGIQPINCTETTERDNEIKTQFQVYSTHKPKKI